MSKKNPHVVPLGNGWAVKKEGEKRATIITTRQSDAIDYARKLAQSERSELVIHGRNGKIRDRYSYGNDPVRRKG